MKLVDACLCSRDDRESSFQLCGGRDSLVQACFCAVESFKAVLTSDEDAVKHV